MGDKDKAVKQLKQQGYNVENSNGVVVFYYPPEMGNQMEDLRKKSRKALDDIGYMASWGITFRKDNKPFVSETSNTKEED